MAKQKSGQQRLALQKFLAYVLGRRPDEYGLFTDEEGFVPVKELLQALGEEEGWRHVRQAHLDEVLREADSGLEARDKFIRAAPEATTLNFGPFPEAAPPKLLYYGARRKAYPAILKDGLTPLGGRPYLPLTADQDLALRIGRRREADPILLTVHATLAEGRVTFYRPQEMIYLVESLDPDLFTGPPLPKERPDLVKKKKPAPPAEPPTPGSFFLDPQRDLFPSGKQDKPKKGKKDRGPEWKRAVRQERRKKKSDD